MDADHWARIWRAFLLSQDKRAPEAQFLRPGGQFRLPTFLPLRIRVKVDFLFSLGIGPKCLEGVDDFLYGRGVLGSARTSTAAGEAPIELSGGLTIDVDASFATPLVKKDFMLSCCALLSRSEFFFDVRTGGIVAPARRGLK
ncbi:hypothetical protein J3458_001499 [Metarhizium acridum]|uniref:uncharacterized protein n=1 Tax=Metarhizium acridum TaxID=92637 RepID=UPI001C6AE5E1|nr:hypothetical protein J3458_001499 [Metarhizium acridum]